MKNEQKVELNCFLDFLSTLDPEEYKAFIYSIESYRAKAMIEKLQ